ncbi:MAG TPA: hypothetical protein VE644_04570, partial [Gaiellaceae bacterium]|nr:hypothetical protein [Gaiellaceae bacterium]
MREGPLAELFRATEAAQRQAEKGEEPGRTGAAGEQGSPPSEEAPTVESAAAAPPPPPAPAPPVREPVPAQEPASPPRPPQQERAVEQPPVRTFIEPAPRLRTTPRPESAAYLAVIRVV